MKNKHCYFQIVLLGFAFFVFYMAFAGCDSTKTLDWNKTASDQELEIGDTIIVEGVVYDSVGRDIKLGKSSGKVSWIKQRWKPVVSASVYKPYKPDAPVFNPNTEIAFVVCTIYNPSSHESLQRLDDIYSESSSNYPMLEHKIKFVGTITRLDRKFEISHNEKPDTFLNTIRIDVVNLNLIGSQLVSPDNPKYSEWK